MFFHKYEVDSIKIGKPLQKLLPLKKLNLGFFQKTKRSCHRQDPFQNINPNITLEIKSFFLITILWFKCTRQFFFNFLNQKSKFSMAQTTETQRKCIFNKIAN